jgi:hypothetical protein
MILHDLVVQSLNCYSLEYTQKNIKTLNKELIKNKVVLAICLIAYIAISAATIAFAAFYSPISLPLATGAAAMALNGFFNSFVKPKRLAISNLKEKIGFENKVASTLNSGTSRSTESTGASNHYKIKANLFRPLLARYDQYEKRALEVLKSIDEIFSKAAIYDGKGKPLNYKALKDFCKTDKASDADINLLEKYKARKATLIDDFLEARVHQIALAHAIQTPIRAKNVESSFQIHRERKTKAKDERFVTFTNGSGYITRKELYDAHKKTAKLCFKKPSEQKIFNQRNWEDICKVNLEGYNQHTVHRSKDLLMLTEARINQMFLKRFYENDDFTLEADVRRVLRNKETLHFNLNLPQGFSLHKEESSESSGPLTGEKLRCHIRTLMKPKSSNLETA